MSALPSGTVTFAFTDIEGSTALLKRLGEGYGDVLSDHRRIVRETFGATNGAEIDTQGDAFFFAFPSARDAVAASVAAQRAHASHVWPHDTVVRVRIGLHTGEPALGEEGYLGLDVVRAARICTVARGGTVLLSESTRALLGSTLPAGVAVFPRGERQLKDIDEPERVYELDIDGVTTNEAARPPERARTEAKTDERAAVGPVSKATDHGGEPTESFGERIAGDIRRQVLEKLERKLGSLTGPSDDAASGGSDDADNTEIDDIAARAPSLEERIQAKVAELLRAKGISIDEKPDA